MWFLCIGPNTGGNRVAGQTGPKGSLEKFMGLFTEMRAGEGPTALLLCLNVFILMTTYYIIKPVREALILSGGGAELKSYLSAGMVLLLLGIIPLYAKLASQMPRKRLINVVTLFFVGCLVLFYVLAKMEIQIGVVFFLWVGIFNLMVVAQFWAFANDIYTPEEGKRLFVIVAFGMSAGAVVGSLVTGRLVEPLGLYQLLLLSAALLVLSLVITNIVDARERKKNASLSTAKATEADEPIGKGGSFQLVLGNRYLLLIAFSLLLLNWVNTTGEYILGATISGAAEQAVLNGTAGDLTEGEFIGKFYSDFFAVVNVVGLLMQLFLVSRIVKFLGIRIGILILPLIALGGYVILAFFPILSAIRWAKTAENSTDYSLNNTVRNILFLPTTREQKYKAKQAIDTFFVRAGDVLSALLVFVGTTYFAFGTSSFALFNIVLVLIWFGIALSIGRRFESMNANRGES